MTFRNYRDKEVVFSQGDPADSVSYIESGTVKLTAVSTRKKAIIAILRRGSFFGEGCLAGQSLRICTARSIGPSNVIRLQKDGMVRTLKRDPKFATLFVGYLLSRVVRIEEDLIDQFFNFSERRLARVLLLFGDITKESKSDSPLKVSQSTLAEMVGTTRPRVSKFMNEFKKKGLVSYNGGLQINSAQTSRFWKIARCPSRKCRPGQIAPAFATRRPPNRTTPWGAEARNEDKATNAKATVFGRLSYVRCGCREAVRSGCWWPTKRTTQEPKSCGC